MAAFVDHDLIPRELKNLSGTNSSTIRILQYNILADALSHSTPNQNFCKVPQDCLSWSFRSQQLLKQIKSFNADVLCLEEVEEKHFTDFLVPSFPEYQTCHVPKKDSPCFHYADNNGSDGVALFFRTSRFTLKEAVQQYLHDEDGKEGKNPILVNVLEDKQSLGSQLIVAVTHFKAKHGFEERRKAQAESSIAVLRNVSLKYPEASVFFCGDFNGEPNEPFYAALQEAGYKSSFVEGLGAEPEFTTWKIRPSGEVRHTIDFVWQRVEGSYAVSGVLDVMKDSDVPDVKFPAYGQPSDHIPLCFDFTKN